MSYKLDLHIHTESHGRAFIEPGTLRETLQRKGLDGLAVTNFFGLSHAMMLKDELKDFIIIVGQEIWTRDGHVIGLGIKERIEDFQDAATVIDMIHAQGGIAIAPHPFFWLGIGEKAYTLAFDAVETYSAVMGSLPFLNHMASLRAEKIKKAQVASSDTTSAQYLGSGITEVFADKPDDILDAIREGRTRLHKKAIPLPVGFIVKNFLGFKDIDICPVHAVPCFICERSMAVRLIKRKCRCNDCGKIVSTRILCSNGHFLCRDCVVKRGVSLSNNKMSDALAENIVN